MTDLNAAIAAIWERNRPVIAERLDAIDAAVTEGADGAAVERGAREAHKLAGSLGTFGFPEASLIASELEHALGAGAPGPGTAELARRLREIVASDRPGGSA